MATLKNILISRLFSLADLAKRPLACGLMLFILGIICAEYTGLDFFAVLSIIGFGGLIFLFTGGMKKNSLIILLGVLMFAAGALSYVDFKTLPENHINNIIEDSQARVYLKGTVRSLPVYKWQKWNRRQCSFVFDISCCETNHMWVHSRGLSQVYILDNRIPYDYGDIVLIHGNIKKIHPEEENRNQGYAGYLHRKGINAIIDIEGDEDIVILSKVSAGDFKKNIHDLRYGIQRRLLQRLHYPESIILSAMLVGRRGAIPEGIKELFISTGTIHILSVSGLHVAVISGLLFFLMHTLRFNKKIIVLIVTIFLGVYIIVAGERTPVIRASIMIVVYIFSTVLDRDFDIYSALSLAGLIILIARPAQVFDPGFQLSFACVFFIVYLTPRLENVFLNRSDTGLSQQSPGHLNRFFFYMKGAFFASLAVFIGVWPIIAFHFRIVSPITVAANLFVVPLLGIILYLGIIVVLLPVAAIPLIYLVVSLLHILFYTMFNILTIISNIPFASLDIPGFSWLHVFGYYIILYIVVSPWTKHKI
jgi:competence protein ComEC